ncbi:membrane protein [Enterococcus florum]|uniref:Membrane protein n=1 Tax=Enterococcus florum TaxID=2480627 RepID=A0A4P5P375_9ENTE|nr:DUF924 family protein [Enterococcus florum]GCF92175.1 membrane protein [Enterococcus florum]
MNYQEILRFWFEECEPEQWFKKDQAFDEIIRVRFSEIHQKATMGELAEWRSTVEGRLAEIIVLDQFSRNLYRGDSKSFAFDGMALVLAQEAISHTPIDQLTVQQRSFLYMPFMHSESLMIHETALRLFAEEGMEENLIFEQRHQRIIARFGRYPHRNDVLGRTTTKEEQAFLLEPNSSF